MNKKKQRKNITMAVRLITPPFLASRLDRERKLEEIKEENIYSSPCQYFAIRYIIPKCQGQIGNKK